MDYYPWHVLLIFKRIIKLFYINYRTPVLVVLGMMILASCHNENSTCVVNSSKTNESEMASNAISTHYLVDIEDYSYKPILDAIGRAGPEEKEEYWRGMLGSADPRLAMTAAIRQQYYYPWPETKSVLEKLIRSPRLGIRVRAVHYYQMYYGVTRESVKQTISILDSHSMSVHHSALSILGVYKAEQFEPELPKILREIYKIRPNSEDQPSLTGWRDVKIAADVTANNMERKQKSQ